jgi:hypothetical protein
MRKPEGATQAAQDQLIDEQNDPGSWLGGIGKPKFKCQIGSLSHFGKIAVAINRIDEESTEARPGLGESWCD